MTAMKDPVTCSVHSVQRPKRFMEESQPGVWSCRPGDACRGKKEGDELVDMCDLCNSDIPVGSTIDEHILTSHGTLLKYCNEFVDKSAAMESAVVRTSHILEFGQTIVQLASKADPGASVFRHAIDARNQLEVILQTKFPKCNVYMFGSCVACGSWDGKGDVDFTLVDPVGWDNRTWPEDEANVVSGATRCLRDAGFNYDELQPLLRTRVPIVKHVTTVPIDPDILCNRANRSIRYEFTKRPSEEDMKRAVDSFSRSHRCHWSHNGHHLNVEFPTGAEALQDYMSHSSLILSNKDIKYRKKWARYGYRPSIFSIQFDVSTRGFGVRNSFLLRAYLEQSAAVRCGSVFIKHWSKYSGVNYSMRGYITSYAVNLLWIHYLLAKRQVTFVDPNSISPSMNDKRHVSYISMLPERGSNSEFEREVGELVAGFFRYYALEFDWKRDVATVSRPELTTKESLRWIEENEVHSKIFRERVWYRFCIEDPFEDNLNLARHVSPIKLHKVRMEFMRAYSCLLAGNCSRLMLDRSAAASKAACIQLVNRALIGEIAQPLRHVLDYLQDHDAETLAAFEVEFATNSLFEAAGVKVKNDIVSLPPDPEGRKKIPKSALPHIDKIDAALSASPHCGVLATDEFSNMNLHHLYYFDQPLNRYFVRERDGATLRQYVSVVKRLKLSAEHDDVADDVATETIETALREAGIVIDEAILAIATEASRPRSKKMHPNFNENSKKVTMCDQCNHHAVPTWASKDERDTGRYCMQCWLSY